MRKQIFIVGILLGFTFNSNAQLIEGDVISDGRKLVTPVDFVIEGFEEGVLFYQITVDREGKVQAIQYIPEGSMYRSTPTDIRAKNFIKKLAFTPKSNAPLTQSVKLKLTVKKKA
jgi:hypothetical protein